MNPAHERETLTDERSAEYTEYILKTHPEIEYQKALQIASTFALITSPIAESLIYQLSTGVTRFYVEAEIHGVRLELERGSRGTNLDDSGIEEES